jgi:SAM-dependent methyltransferase
MRPDLIKDLYEKEATYWWNVCKREMVSALSGRNGPPESRPSGFAIDIGCGGGYTAKLLESRWRSVAADLSQEALQFSRRRGVSLLCQVDMTSFSLPFKNNSFDLVLALDVIEHVEDDVRALAECRRILKDNGLLIVTVPAFMWLWSPWDEALGHRRRYTTSSLADSIHRAGLAVKKLSYSFFFIFPIAVLVRGVKRLMRRDALRYSSDFIPIPSVLNSGLIQAGRLEQWIITKLNCNLPIGLSVISLATKR